MYSTSTHIAELQKSHLDALNAFNSTLLSATEQFANLNLAAARAMIHEAAQITQSLLSSKDAQEAMAIAGGLVQPATEKLVSYSRNIYSIGSSTNAEISKIVDDKIAEGNRKVAELIDSAVKNAPAGSEVAVSFLKSALSASNSAYDSVSKAARKATELVETNLAAAASAATDAVKSKARKAS